ncbi:MAG: ATP-binding cassette domain-containing protein [Puniceicoccales bacterium]|jgi:ABC-type lipoprotein export system ATPase subunit|nr:ATP-binding cassette domain-containing protein [Puniceicoccales bacterium]
MLEGLGSVPCVALRGIRKGFCGPQGRTEILRDLSFSLFPGDSVGITGVSGAGKSTFLHILAALEKPDSGEVFWNGEALHTWPGRVLARRRAAQIGFVFQSCPLVPELDLLENLLLPCRIFGRRALAEGRRRAEILLERLGLSSHRFSLPMGLSGGERQRVALARAFMNRPRLIVADEPTGNLDESTGEQVMRLLEDIRQEEQTALLLVTHHLPFSRRLRRQYRLHQGVLEPL